MIDKIPDPQFMNYDRDGAPDESAMTRRQFLTFLGRGAIGLCALTGVCAAAGGSLLQAAATSDTLPQLPAVAKDDLYIADARYWKSLGENRRVRCGLCPLECVVPPGGRGHCRVRENRKGAYKTLVYNRPVSMNVDPIEKKPLFHYLPGSRAFSLATVGCNIECLFCQNWQISQARPEDIPSKPVTPSEMAGLARKSESPVIAFTYSEPTVYYEYMYDIAAEGKKIGLRSVMISNGFMQEQPLRDLCGVLSAVKIDLKAFTEKFYHETCSGQLKPVLKTLEVLRDMKMWFEIVVLIVPTLNDSPSEIREMARWIRQNLGPDVPVHFTRFSPTYKIRNLPRTPVATMEKCHDIAREAGLRFVYLGNVWNHRHENTYCPSCEKMLIRRQGYYTEIIGLDKGACRHCGTAVPGVWI